MSLDMLFPLDLLLPLETEELCLEMSCERPVTVTAGRNVSGGASSSEFSAWHQNKANTVKQ